MVALHLHLLEFDILSYAPIAFRRIQGVSRLVVLKRDRGVLLERTVLRDFRYGLDALPFFNWVAEVTLRPRLTVVREVVFDFLKGRVVQGVCVAGEQIRVAMFFILLLLHLLHLSLHP